MNNEVDHPKHYTWIPGVEVIDVLEPLCKQSGWNITNAVKYLLRADNGKGKPQQDMRKAMWYIQRELDQRAKRAGKDNRGTVRGEFSTRASLCVSSVVLGNACKDSTCTGKQAD